MQPDMSSRFVKYSLTEDEELRGSQFSSEQIAIIQNARANAADEVINNLVTPISGTEYDKLILARLQGEIKAYDYLLGLHEFMLSNRQSTQD